MKTKKINKWYIIAGVIFLLLVITIGASYAYWMLNYQQTGMNKVATSCFNLALTNEGDSINLQEQYPLTTEEGMKLVPYKFTV